jgi:hypothetical protein
MLFISTDCGSYCMNAKVSLSSHTCTDSADRNVYAFAVFAVNVAVLVNACDTNLHGSTMTTCEYE